MKLRQSSSISFNAHTMNLDEELAAECGRDFWDTGTGNTGSECVHGEVDADRLETFATSSEEEGLEEDDGRCYGDAQAPRRYQDEEDEEEEGTHGAHDAHYIMNQKTLSDKAPGSVQHSFAHRTIPQPDGLPMRLLQFCAIFVIAVLSAGLPFGSPMLVHMMLDEGVFETDCSASSPSVAGTQGGCAVQEAWLAVLQVSSWATWLVAGWLGARLVQGVGPRATGMLGTGCLLGGAVALALSLPVDGAHLLPRWARATIPAVTCMSVGSALTFLACLHYVRLFPKRTALLHALVFLAQDLGGLVLYMFLEMQAFMSLRSMFLSYAGAMALQLLVWKALFAPCKIPTIRFTVTLWHQRPLLVDQRLVEHVASPYFGLAVAYAAVVYARIFFYMSTFRIQLRILLMPTTCDIDPEDFMYHPNEPGGTGSAGATMSYIPFFAEQPGGTSSNVLALRQFTYNPMQPEIFLTDLQEMLFLLLPTAALVSVFWMRASTSDWKISSTLLFANLGLLVWGVVQ